MSRLRKAASFASLRRDRDRSPTTQQSDSPKALSSASPRNGRQRSDPPSPLRQYPKEPEAHVFPSLDRAEDDGEMDLLSYPQKQYHSNLHPSSRPSLRLSGSSGQTYLESPLSTPIDYSFTQDSMHHYPAVVAVETMDALVDGMNGGQDHTPGLRSSRLGGRPSHPLYHPPLPTPPPGVTLGGRIARVESDSSDSGDEDANNAMMRSAIRSRRRRTRRPVAADSPKVSTPPKSSAASPAPNHQRTPKPPFPRSRSFTSRSSRSATNLTMSPSTPPPERAKTVAPSISDIIRNHSTVTNQSRPRLGTSRSSSLHSLGFYPNPPVPEESEDPPTIDEEILSRSSVDSIAAEVERTIRNQVTPHATPHRTVRKAPSFGRRHSVLSEGGLNLSSPVSENGVGSSVYSLSINPDPPSPISNDLPRATASEAIAQYLRSSRLTTLLKLTRSPHASPDNPLTVSLSDLGNPDGFPLVVFLGLGCVRHIMGLYDEMAHCLNLRLITIDRWGLGRTEPRSKSAKGITQWAAVVEEALDMLHIDQCSVMAHSAGAPYALSFANSRPERIRGDVCLLAPWVGGRDGAGAYKWLKYVPNGILKTAQAAEWKLQAWMIGRPPTLSYQGIGYDASTPSKSVAPGANATPSRSNPGTVYHSSHDGKPRPSIASSTFSEYDDLQDFNGRFDSRSTVGASVRDTSPPCNGENGSESKLYVTRKKSARGILGILRGGGTITPHSPPEEKRSVSKRIKSLRSMSSLKEKSPNGTYHRTTIPQLPQPCFDLQDLKFDLEALEAERDSLSSNKAESSSMPVNLRAMGRRSLSFHHPPSKRMSFTPSPNPSAAASVIDDSPINTGSEYQAALGNALIAASHAESAKGTHTDLLQILNHENHSWGFNYSTYPHVVHIWYGEKDEKIAENAVRWMEKTMGESRCSVKVVKGADHGLMYKSGVVVEVLERVAGFWKSGAGDESSR